MKLISYSILLRFSLLIILFFVSSYTTPPYDKSVDVLIQRATTKLKKKYGLKLLAVKEGMMDCVKLIGPQFQIYKELTKDEARSLVVNCVQDLLEEINKDEKIRPYLEAYPFGLAHVEVIIFIYMPTGKRIYHPNLAVVSACRGSIRYSTNDPENEFKYKSEETESFEEALKILKEQKERVNGST